MAPHCQLMNHYQCCGINVTYFEQCGHTTTEADHHPACEYRKADSLPQPRQLTPFTQLGLRQPFPRPYPKCRDLHRFIDLSEEKCPSCTDPPQVGSWNQATSSFASIWAPLSEQQIFERGVYWLNEMLLAREEKYQGDLSDWEAGLLDRREVENSFDIPTLERTFGYDPAGLRGSFMTKVSKVSSEDKTHKCGACKEEKIGNVMSRKLPCGCVLHLKCIQRWFAVRKTCPHCAVDFKLVKIPRREDASAKGTAYYPIWSDDGYFNFI